LAIILGVANSGPKWPERDLEGLTQWFSKRSISTPRG